jgi:hypothetical protein
MLDCLMLDCLITTAVWFCVGSDGPLYAHQAPLLAAAGCPSGCHRLAALAAALAGWMHLSPTLDRKFPEVKPGLNDGVLSER